MGNAYEDHREHASGVALNKQEAIKWFRLAAVSKDCKDAHFNLGILLTNGGEDVSEKAAEGWKWMKKAARGGHKNAIEFMKNFAD